MTCHIRTNMESLSGIAEMALLLHQYTFQKKLSCLASWIKYINCDKTFYEVCRVPVIVMFFMVFPLAYLQYKEFSMTKWLDFHHPSPRLVHSKVYVWPIASSQSVCLSLFTPTSRSSSDLQFVFWSRHDIWVASSTAFSCTSINAVKMINIWLFT